MELSTLYSDPLDPSRSIQLNNRYWPGDRFQLLTLIREAEGLVARGDLASAGRELQRLRKHFKHDMFYRRFMFRLHRLRTFRSSFGHRKGRIEVDDDVIRANAYAGAETRASYPLASARHFEELVRETTNIYRDQYGRDLIGVNCTVRFAKPDSRQLEVTEHGPLSDYHNDEMKGVTTVVYLSDVKDSNGAFSFIPGSHLIPRSLILTAIHQVVDFDMGLRTTEQLTAVPLEFRGSACIGNFLDEEKVDVLYNAREVLEGDVGTFVTFNGQYVLHRGGKPTVGTRTAAFIQPEGLLRHKLKSVYSLAASWALSHV